ncbi:MAG: ADP-ribosylglycohydrolase family protein [Polyangiales bacterium]
MTDRGRVAGSLYGLLAGDALGCPVEGWSPEEIRARYGTLDAMEVATGRWRPAGLHSDDGQQAMALCDALLEDPDAPEAPFARILVEVYEAGPTGRRSCGGHRGPGGNFRDTVRGLAGAWRADPWCASKVTAGNGLAMLVAPAAWRFPTDRARRDEAIVRAGRVKSRDLRAFAGAVAVAEVVAHGVRHGEAPLDPAALVAAVREGEDVAARALRSAAHLRTFSDALADALAELPRGREAALARVCARAAESSERPVEPGAAYVLASGITSVLVALAAPSFGRAVVDVVALGGDADTTGAMVGAMAGARFGLDGIPAPWLRDLVARGAFDDRVDALCGDPDARRWRPPRRLADLERAWTATLYAAR